MKPKSSSYLASMKTHEGRNELFPFLAGLLLIAGGSASTLFYFISAIVVLFLNPRMKIAELGSEIYLQHKLHKILLIFPLFVFSLFIFSVTRPNSGELLNTLASHIQLLFIVPIAVGIHAISKSEYCLTYFINGLRAGIMLILPIALLQVTVFNIRPEGFSGNSLIFAFMLCLACVLCLVHGEAGSLSRGFVDHVPSVCAFFMIIISFSRAPILLVFILASITLLFFVRRTLSVKNFIAVISLFTICTVLGIGAIASTDFGARYFDKRIIEPIKNLTEGELSDTSIRKRIDLNISGLYAFKDNPLAGYGLQNTVDAANSISQDSLGKQTNYSFSHLHNEYLTYAVAGGIFVFVQYLIILLVPLLLGRATPLKEFSILVSMAFSAIALTNIVLGHDITSTFFSICVVIILLTRMNE